MPQTPARRRELKYGMTDGEFEARMFSQNNACAICGTGLDKPHIDHCHECSEVRGLLCHLCNLGIGCFKDNPRLLAAAIVYLEDNRCK